MNILDKYMVTNKRAKLHGEYIWLIDSPNENGVAKFLDRYKRTIRLKMSSVEFVSPRLANGAIVKDGNYSCTVNSIHWYRRYYICEFRDGIWAGMRIGKWPWEISPLKAEVV